MPGTFLSGDSWSSVHTFQKAPEAEQELSLRGNTTPSRFPRSPRQTVTTTRLHGMAPADRNVEAFFPRMPPSIRSGSPWRALQPRAHHVSPLGMSTEPISGLCVLFMGICAASPSPSHQLWHLGTTTITAPGGVSGKEPACRCRRCERCGFDP